MLQEVSRAKTLQKVSEAQDPLTEAVRPLNHWVNRWLLVGLVMLATLPPSAAAVADDIGIPPALAPWVPWVLHDADERDCALAPESAERLCQWPAPLHLHADQQGGRFSQSWRLDAPGWVALPGDAHNWPQQLRVNGQPQPVLARQDQPVVWLPAGEHDLSGTFLWSRPPDGLRLPEPRARVHLQLKGTQILNPRIDDDGRVWLGSAPEAATGTERGAALALDVTRRLTDGVPVRLNTRLELEVSGPPRELRLQGAILPAALPLRLDSPLPAHLDEEGQLQLQLRPGRWVVQVESRYPGRPTRFELPAAQAPWPQREVWVFRADPELRQVEVSGVAAVDPRQTRLPADWQSLPAYGLQAGDALVLEPVPLVHTGRARLQLKRELWLDFNGQGYSLRDRISGDLAGVRRLEVRAPVSLGQVRVNDEPRLITRLAGDERGDTAGVEVRGETLSLVADGRLDGVRTGLPTSGWTHPFERIHTQLYLPPGWDLLAVSGVDNLPDTWLARWSLLDLFLVLIAVLACARLWGWPWGGLALVTLMLIWQEPGAPRTVWLHLLAAAALLRLLPQSREAAQPPALHRARTLVQLYFRATLVVLVLIALPFLSQQMRDGLYPQLSVAAPHQPGTAVREVAQAEPQRAKLSFEAYDSQSSAPSWHAPPPGALLQTGAGVPDWNWNAFALHWHGPLALDHEIRLWLLPPLAALLLAGAALLLVPALALRIAGGWPGWQRSGPATRQTLGLAFVLLSATWLLPGSAWAQTPAIAPSVDMPQVPARTANFPPEPLLEALRTRLLAPPKCWPECVSLSQLHLRLQDQHLHLRLSVAAGAAGALPLPGGDAWPPQQVTLDGADWPLAQRTPAGSWLIPLPAGQHRVELTGPIEAGGHVELPLPLTPRLVTTDLDPAWQLEGLRADGQAGTQLRLVPVTTPAASPASSDRASAMIPLLRLERELHLGLTWELRSRARRLSPATTSVSLRLPLLPGEAVTSAEAQVVDGQVLLSLAPGQQQLTWSSRLAATEPLVLHASTDPRLVETWCIGVSPFWHLQTAGLDPVASGCASAGLATAAQLWRPWPGETLELTLTRPLAVPGPTLTLDQTRYTLKPGRRASEAHLELTMRSSQGGQHGIRLPPGAEQLETHIDGQRRGLALKHRQVDLPLVPGVQRVELSWQQPGGMTLDYRPPQVDVGVANVNANTEIQLGADRWVLWIGGAGVGPAVLFWSLLAVLTLLAWGLARLRLTPLGWVDWLLLGIGLSQADVWVAVLVVGWLLALGWRQRLAPERLEAMSAWRFDLAQLAVVGWTLVALLGLLAAIQQGLLGPPRMQIAGNDSQAGLLRWYLDRSGPQLGEVLVVSVPMLVYRLLMLAWALWLALRLLDWLRWGWQVFSQPWLWRALPPMTITRSRPGARDAAQSGRTEKSLSLDL